MLTITPAVEAVLERAAELRAEGSSWNNTAIAMGYVGDDLKGICKDAGQTYERLYSKARRAVVREALSESMFTLRRLLREGAEADSRRAAECLSRISMTFIRHRRRAAVAKGPKPDPRLEGMSAETIEMAKWLSVQTPADLEKYSDILFRRHKRYRKYYEMYKNDPDRDKVDNQQADNNTSNGSSDDPGSNPVPREPSPPSGPTGSACNLPNTNSHAHDTVLRDTYRPQSFDFHSTQPRFPQNRAGSLLESRQHGRRGRRRFGEACASAQMETSLLPSNVMTCERPVSTRTSVGCSTLARQRGAIHWKQTPRPGRKGSDMSRVALALAMFVSPAVVAAAEPQSNADLVKTAQSVFKDLKTVTLENGLRVYLLPVKGSPVVSVMVAYKVGSADEEKDQTGLSHYLEHLMFKGTEKLMPGDIDRATQRNGGQNNAYTSEDMTVYHFDFAADRWQSALDIEGDRMRNIRIDAKHEFQQEKGAVISELNGNEDSPGDLEYKAILTLLWPKESPYSHPVIGQREHVQGATAEIIKRHYDKWYHPNNAALVIAGGFNPDETLVKIKKIFEPIPKGELPKRKTPTYFKDRAGPVHKEFESKFDQPRMVMGFNTVAVGTTEDPILDVIQYVLADGKTSRLYRKLVEDERVCSSVDAGNYAGRYPGWFAVTLDLLKGKDRKKAEEMVFAELEKLATTPLTDEELNRARKKLLARFVFSRESVHSLADAIARTSTYPGGEDVTKFFADYLERIVNVSKADVQRVAKEYLARKQACVVWSVPPEAKKCEPESAVGATRSAKPVAFRAPPAESKDAGGAGEFSLANAKRTVLPNGLTVILLEDHKLPVVVGAVDVADVGLRQPADKNGIAMLVGSLLEEGTTKHTGKQISALIEDTGGSLSLSGSGGSFKVLTPDTELALSLMFDCLQNPSFPAEAFAQQKEQQLAGIDDAATQPQSRASDTFHALVYGKHPYARPSQGTRATVEKLTAEDCKAFHKLAFAPNFTTVVLVGDFKAAEMLKKIEELTKDWKKSDAGKAVVEAPPKGTTVVEQIISDPAAAQVHVFIGQLGITRDNPDYYKLLVMDNVLGTGPGFTDRLSSTLRDRQGLAYTVRATIASGAGTQPGTFTGYIGTFADKFLDVKHGFIREFNRIRDEAPSKEEVEDAKKYLLGSMPFRFTTMSAVAGQLLAAEKYGLGTDFLEKYKKEVAAVTPEDVQAVAKKYLDPKTLTIVVVGAIDKDGKPLGKKK